MQYNFDLIVLEIFFLFCFLVGLFLLKKPDFAISKAIGWYKFILKLNGFEAEIRSTAKTLKICRIWNLSIIIIFGLLMVVLPFIIRK